MPSELVELPVYPPSEAARYARTTPQSIARWRAGYSFPTATGEGHSDPVTGGATSGLLSFNDLVEIAVVAAARRANVPMRAIRRAVETAKDLYGVDRPLSALRFQHDGRSLFSREGIRPREEHFVNLSRNGQLAWAHVADVLRDLDYEDELAARWYPDGRSTPIVIDPSVSFGRPYLITKGVSTDAVRSRFLARESLPDIAEDLGLTEGEAEAALRFELPQAA